MVNNVQTLMTSIYEPKTLSETMNDQQIYYETMYILRPDIAEDEVNNHIEKYNKLLEECGGTILDSQMRGKRRLAYQISKHREGIYVQLSHQGDGQHISKIEKSMRLSEDVIRYMTVKQEGPLPTPRPSTKGSTQSDDKENPEAKDESKEKQPVVSVNTSTSEKDDTPTK
jgi:small subunit ribosomal protein S6